MNAYVEEEEAPSVRLTRAMFPRAPLVMSQKLTSVGVLWVEGHVCKREVKRPRFSWHGDAREHRALRDDDVQLVRLVINIATHRIHIVHST